MLSIIEPKTKKEAVKYDDWVKAMEEELEKIEKNETWTLVPIPENKNVIGTKWVFRNKMDKFDDIIFGGDDIIFGGDDIIFGGDDKMRRSFAEQMKQEFEMLMIGCKLSKYDESEEVNEIIYWSMIGKLQYGVHSRLNISQAVGLVAKFSANLKETHGGSQENI
ncbi:hypothetical protein SUGI_0899920 [Cryptomeria japonica]|nr:hypothetical protein SUGI_0899920 [Cryptomeria japonica]